MPGKVQHDFLARRTAAVVGLVVVAIAAAAPSSVVSGRVTMLDRENQPGDDVGQAVIWLSGAPAQPRPASDGSFTLSGVPAGNYTLHAWHERTAEIARPLSVPAEGVEQLALEL